MFSIIERKTSYTFWLLQITGWLLYWLYFLFLAHVKYLVNFSTRVVIWTWLIFFSGLWISLILRIFYKNINYKSLPLFSLSLNVLLASFIGSQFWIGLDYVLDRVISTEKYPAAVFTFAYYLLNTFSWWSVLVAWSVLYFFIKFWIEWQLQKKQTEKSNELAHSAQLQMLRFQLNPHFLFNALNSIRALIKENKTHAKEMITELSEFLRYSLLSKNYLDVPLEDEIDAIKHYFSIEKKRYEDKLDVSFEIEPAAEQYPVLSFLIHPLVENALKYGMQTSPIPLWIRILARVEGSKLVVEICNTGKWLKNGREDSPSKSGTGTGLKNIRQRLENAFPNRHSFQVIKDGNSVRIRLEIDKKPVRLRPEVQIEI